jgi:hypothetical protein
VLALELGTGAGFGAGGGCNKYRCFFWSLGMEHVQAWTALASEQVLTSVGTGAGFGIGSGPVVAMEQAQALALVVRAGAGFEQVRAVALALGSGLVLVLELIQAVASEQVLALIRFSGKVLALEQVWLWSWYKRWLWGLLWLRYKRLVWGGCWRWLWK